MRNPTKKLERFLSMILLGIIVTLVYHKWLFSLSLLTQGDWIYYFQETLTTLRANYFSLWLADFTFGRLLIDVGQAPTYALTGILGHYFQWELIERILYFFPIAIFTPISAWILARRIFQTTWAALTMTIIYCFNTYFLTLQTGHLTLMAAFSFAPFIFYLFRESLQKSKSHHALLTALLLFIAGSYEPRAIYVVLILLALYSIFFVIFESEKLSANQFITIGITLGTFILLNFYWLFGLAHIGDLQEQELLKRTLWGDQYFDILKAFTLFHPWWTGKEIAVFEEQEIPYYLIITTVTAFTGLYLQRKNKLVVFFSIIGLIGILLTKQTAKPFPELYPWLFRNIPGFQAFREASKFYFLIVFSYSVLIGAFVEWLWLNNNAWKFHSIKRIFITVFICLLFLWNTKPFISGEIETLFVDRQIPIEYITLKKFLLNQTKYFRTFWAPRTSRWALYSDVHPLINSVDITSTEPQIFSKLLTKGGLKEQIISPFKHEYSNHLFDASSIKYVMVPIQDTKNNDDFFIHYGGRDRANIHEWYIDQINRIPFLKKIDVGTKDLAVYENTGYRPYITAIDDLLSFNSLEQLDAKYTFAHDVLQTPFDFILSNTGKNLPVRGVSPVFETLTSEHVLNGNITASVHAEHATLYENTGKSTLLYTFTRNKLRIFEGSPGRLRQVGSPVAALQPWEKTVYEEPARLSVTYYAKIGSRLVALEPTDTPRGLGSDANHVEIFAADKDNLIANGSFEEGLWSDKVADCNAYDRKPKIEMNLVPESTDGSNSLELQAARHIACTGRSEIVISPNTSYVFSFDYQSPNAQQAGTFMRMTGTGFSINLSDRYPIADQAWHHAVRLVDVPKSKSQLSLTVYAFAQEDPTTYMVNRYDSFSLRALTKLADIAVKSDDHFIALPLPESQKNTYEFTFSDSERDFNNLIPDASFERKLWKENVSDCNAYDSNGLLDMKQATEASDGSHSLELSATRHIACTGPAPLPVHESGSYLFAFDYQSPNGKEAGYYLGFNDPGHTIVSERMPVKGTEWKRFTKQISAPSGATSASLVLYSYATDGSANIITRYDNVHFIELPDLDNRYYVVSEPQEMMRKPRRITFELINPTKKRVHVRQATKPFILAMSESYHDQWQLQFENDKIHGAFQSWVPFITPDRIPDTQHVELNGFLNGWYVDTTEFCIHQKLCTPNADGTYDIDFVIEFFPQRWFYLGLLISGTTLAGCLGYLAYEGMKRFKKRVTPSVVEGRHAADRHAMVRLRSP